MRRWTCTLAALTLVAAPATPSAAQSAQVPASEVLGARATPPPALTQPALTLNDAILLSLRHSPRLLTGAERVRAAEGRWQEARGRFDGTLRVAPSATFALTEIPPGLNQRERFKRDAILGVRDGFLQTGEGYRRLLAGDLSIVPTCPALFGQSPGLTGTAINLDQADPTEVALSGVDRSVNDFTVDLGGGLGTIAISRICRAQPGQLFSAEAFLGTWRDTARIIDFTGGRGLEGALVSAAQITRETYTLVEEIARTVAQRAQIALDRLGPVARDEFKRNLLVDVSFTKPLRSGTTLRADFQVQSQEHHFVDKPLDPAFGGFDVPHMFFTGFAGTLVQPLGRGRGAAAAAATERSAERFLTAEREQLRHTAAGETFRTLMAYLNVVAAQDRVALLTASRARHAEILRATGDRIASGDVAQIESERVQAHEAGVVAALNQAEADLLAARVSLAEAMGVALGSIDAVPVATEPMARVITGLPDLGVLQAQARQLRRDTRAAAARQAAAAALLEAARTETRQRFDVRITAGLSNLYESPFFRFLPDEAGPIIDSQAPVVVPETTGTAVPPQSPVRYWDPRGYSRALTGRYEPFIQVGLNWELPFGNNRARGRLARAQASLSAATIDVVNLARVVDQDLVEGKQTVEHAARAVTEWESAVANSLRTFESQQRLLGAGAVTVIDLLLTEEALAADEQQLLRQRQVYLSALGRLKFDLGELLFFDAEGMPGEQLRFLSTGLTGR